MLYADGITRELAAYGLRPTNAQCGQITAYISILLKWNRSISLTSVTDETEVLRFHIGESAFALPTIEGIHGRLADVGAGAGFPGLPLKIFRPDIDLTLIESNTKKCAFLSEVARQLGLDGVRVLKARYEDTGRELESSLDTVVSRALGGYEGLLAWCSKVLKTGGRVALWVVDEDARKIAGDAKWDWEPAIPIPGSKQRRILVGSPRKPSGP